MKRADLKLRRKLICAQPSEWPPHLLVGRTGRLRLDQCAISSSTDKSRDVAKELCMLIQVGYELVFYCPQETPMILMVNVHYSRASDIVSPDLLIDRSGNPHHGVSRRLRKLVHADCRAHGKD